MMTGTLFDQILSVFYRSALPSHDFPIAAASLLVAWHEEREAKDVRELFRQFGSRLKPSSDHDALTSVVNWLMDPGFSDTQFSSLEDALSFLRTTVARPVDWTAELAACLTSSRQEQFTHNLSIPIARAMINALELPEGESCACMFSGSSTMAWAIADKRAVTLFSADIKLSEIMALFAHAAGKQLTVDRRNPIDGSYMPAPFIVDSPSHIPPFNGFDHIISLPPFGARIEINGSKAGLFEAVQLERLAPLARRSFTTVIPDGLLFRSSKNEVEFRRNLVDQYQTTVMSLPSGMFGSASGLATSLLHLTPDGQDRVRIIDARSMKKSSIGRVQEQFITQHLEQYTSLQPVDEDRVDYVLVDELALANYSLQPERYLQSRKLEQLEESMLQHQQVALSDIAKIERNKAPKPIRGLVEDPALTALEIAPADIVDGGVRTPRRQVAFAEGEADRVRNVTVQSGDILISIKGNVGIIGIVGIDAALAADMGDPWIISQSLAIIRLEPNEHIPTPDILNALLTAPWVREKLESFSGGSTVRTLPMSAVRNFAIPLPEAAESAQAASLLNDIAELREDIKQRKNNLEEARRALWSQLWHVAPEFGEY